MSSTPHYVCAHDPRSPEDVGAIVPESPLLRRNQSEGAVYLPIDPSLERDLNLGGFVRRSWGPDGWIFDAGRGESGSPSVIQVKAGVPFVHWACEVVPRGPLSSGKLQLWVDPHSTQMLNSGLATGSSQWFDLTPGQPPSRVLRGVARFNGTIDGFLGLGLWGVCHQVGVLWFAVSQSSLES